MIFNQQTSVKKTVGDPSESYVLMQDTWRRCRAIIGGEKAVKQADKIIDVNTYSNILLPFSPSMSQEQYDFYRAEAELPGLVGQYAKALVGGLLRKAPQFQLPKALDTEDNRTWINNSFGAQNQSLISALDEALEEEMTTSRCWLLVDTDSGVGSEVSPYVAIIPSECIINTRKDSNQRLVKLTMRYWAEKFTADNEHHPEYVETVRDYVLDNEGLVINLYEKKQKVSAVNGQAPIMSASSAEWELVDTKVPVVRDERLQFIPARPLNGSVDIQDPMLQTLVNREAALYNKVSRRNHLLYGACTYTPIISGNFATEDDFQQKVVNKGLGSWLNIPEGASATILQTPTAAIKDINDSIQQNVGEMARMGIRMLTPDGSAAESGVALEIKNSAQLSQLGLLNNKASKTLEVIISMMLYMKHDITFEEAQKQTSFTLSEDFNPSPIGADWMRLITEWYESKKIPRSVFLTIAKQNDIIPMDYDDELGKEEIQSDSLVMDSMPKVDTESILRNNLDNKGQ